MRESFVFHKDYIEDLPDQYKTEFMQATINYGLYGENPPFKDGTLEMALWAKIARRIDAEAEKYKEISEKRKEAAQKRYQQYQQRMKPAREEPAKTEQAEQKAATPEESPAESQTAKMKDWRASVRTWEQRRKTEQTGGRNKAGGMWGKENEIPEDYFNLI